jgi:hypothetical protein
MFSKQLNGKSQFDIDRYEIWKVKPSAVVMEGKVIQGKF